MHRASGRRLQRLDLVRERREELVARRQPRSMQKQIAVVVRDPFDDPQTSRVRLALVVEWTEGDGRKRLPFQT